ncbi:MAG TPA: hypothetical protein VF796_26465 [Humisphaera sp.]
MWAFASAAGAAVLWSYEARPGRVGAVAATWPTGSRLTRSAGRCTLVVAMSPRCACSLATVREAELILSRARVPVDAVVLMTGPAAEGTDLWRRSAAIPGVRVVPDPDGREAEAFGAATSGHVVLYDPAGRLRFSGGITPSRGHAGDNAGREAVLALLGCGTSGAAGSAVVYGCPVLSAAPAGGTQ